ncbi:caspase family protein [Terasakiella pusilla]|uniref:caspase family protein n=1 Tax=Terasakiella pusilla TaxID=64973 RepID=UPI003AA91E9D
MSIWYDTTQESSGNKKLYAFLIGVSRYQHMDDETADGPLTFQSLESAATSALHFAKWIRDDCHIPDCDEKKIFLLASPSHSENNPDFSGCAPARKDEVETALEGFLDEAKKNSDIDRIIVYVAGHGIKMDGERPILFLEDFAKPGVGPLKNALDINDLLNAFAGPDTPEIQFFFIDTCQTIPARRHALDTERTGITLSSSAQTVKPQFTLYATPVSQEAYGKPGETSFFCQSLISALKNGFASDRQGKATNESLKIAIQKYFRRHFSHACHGQDPVGEGDGGRWDFHHYIGSVKAPFEVFLAHPPTTTTTIEIFCGYSQDDQSRNDACVATVSFAQNTCDKFFASSQQPQGVYLASLNAVSSSDPIPHFPPYWGALVYDNVNDQWEDADHA